MMLTNESIRKDLKEYLKEFGIKNNYIAKKINMSNSTVSLWLKGERELSPDRLQIIANIMSR